MCVYPEGPERVVEVEDYDGGKGEGVGECRGNSGCGESVGVFRASARHCGDGCAEMRGSRAEEGD